MRFTRLIGAESFVDHWFAGRGMRPDRTSLAQHVGGNLGQFGRGRVHYRQRSCRANLRADRGDFAEAHGEIQFVIDVAPTADMNLEKLLKGRLDGAILNQQVAEYYLQEMRSEIS